MRKRRMKPKLEAILKQSLQDLVKTKHIKHAVLAIESMAGPFKWSGAEGIAQPDGTAMTPETPFCIASVTKLFIAATILKLHEQRQISIDESMAAYLPDSLIKGLHRIGTVDYTKKITLRHLLEHSSGLPDYLEIHTKDKKSIFDIVIEEGDRSWSIQDFMDIVREVNAPLFAPQPLEARHKKVRYSDTNYQLLIAIIKEVTSQSLHKVFNEMIYEPLGLKQTFHPGTSPSGSISEVATLWYKDQPLNIPKALASFGDLNSTVGDLLIFLRALISGMIFDDPATIKFMCREWNRFGFSLSPVGPGWPIEYGLGIMRFRYPRFLTPLNPLPEVIGHTGVSGSWLFYCPSLEMLMAGDVSQITAGGVPFQFVPKIIRSLQSYHKN
ncbi:MAG: beta-lactamase family protein [Anaerolineae bacterium]|nr:beta-lactamase family protein [Anaerolineae bacterium]